MPETDFERPRFCSRCGQAVVVHDADYCKHCGAPLASTRVLISRAGFNPLIAFALSIVPGLGHLYKGQVGRGAVWFFVVLFAYGAGPIGYIMHLICATNAALKGAISDDALSRRQMRRTARRRPEAPTQGEPGGWSGT